MIIDSISCAERYHGLHLGIDRVLEAVKEYTPENYPGGRIPLDGENIYLNLLEYDTHSPAEGMTEAHRAYIDVMYMVEGTEVIYIKPVDRLNHVTKEYDPAIEALLADIDEDGCEIRLEQGDFIILFPEDAHAPACHADRQEHVKKIIGKVKINS
jgi:YhcH/YjgK/YiaL family protein